MGVGGGKEGTGAGGGTPVCKGERHPGSMTRFSLIFHLFSAREHLGHSGR